MHGIYRRLASKSIGVGGWKCPCCAPANRKTVKLLKRQERRILKRFVSTQFVTISGDTMESAEYTEGKEAYGEDKSLDDNPYEEGSGQFIEWNNGFVFAEENDPLAALKDEDEDDLDDEEDEDDED